MNCKESICRNCFHSYVCEQFNENKDDNNEKCHFFNDHYVPTAGVVLKNEWISVDERLPEDDLSEEHNKKTIKVLVAIKAKNGITIRTQERFRDYTYSNVGDPITFWTWRFSHGKVTHWMPLPAPPIEKEN